VWEWFFSVCCAHACQALPLWSEFDQQRFAKTKIGYIYLPPSSNAIKGITSYYCQILKMVTLHDAIKTIQNGIFMFLKTEQNLILFKKPKTTEFKKTRKKTGGLLNSCFAQP